MTTRPQPDEAATYYFRYIDQAPDGDIVAALTAQAAEATRWLRAVPAARSLARPAPGRWSMRDVVAHLSDAERLFQWRAFWFARGFTAPLPSFDQEVAAAAAGADQRAWTALIDEFVQVRGATVAFFAGLPPEAWDRRGVASGHPVSVRALAFIAAGHVVHHLRVLGQQPPAQD